MEIAETATDFESSPNRNAIVLSKEAIGATLGLITYHYLDLANKVGSMRAGAGALEHLKDAFPSAPEPAEVSPAILGKENHEFDIAAAALPLYASIVLLRGATPKTKAKDLVTLAFAAQVLATAGDTAATETNLLNSTERASTDMGPSAIFIAFFNKYLFDRILATEDQQKRRAWVAVTAVFAGAVPIHHARPGRSGAKRAIEIIDRAQQGG